MSIAPHVLPPGDRSDTECLVSGMPKLIEIF